MSLLEWFTSRWSQNSQKYVYFPIYSERTDRTLSNEVLTSGKHYFRLTLAEMFLQKTVDYGQKRYPAVHSLVQLAFGDAVVELPNIADTSRIGGKDHGSLNAIIARNYVLTPTLPFKGGTITLEAGLIEVMGENYLNSFIKVLGDFAGLLAVPQVSAVLNVVQPLSQGIQQLLGLGKGDVKLSVHDTFSAGNPLRECYLVAVADPNVDRSKLWVVADQLCEGRGLGPGQHKPYVGSDHMVFRFEVLTSRDDWQGLTAIDKPFREALRYMSEGNTTAAEAEIRRAVLAAFDAPELTEAQKDIVVTELRARYKARAAALGGAGVAAEEETLAEVMRNPALSVDEALARGRLTLDEALDLS